MTIKAEIQSLAPSALVELFEIDLSKTPGGTVSYFHAGVNGLQQPVVWQGNTYLPLPIEAEGFDVSAKGAMPRPKLRLANINGLFSAQVCDNDDLIGVQVTRRRTYARFLDAVNFPPPRNLLKNTEVGTAWSASMAISKTSETARKTGSPFWSVGKAKTTAYEFVTFPSATPAVVIGDQRTSTIILRAGTVSTCEFGLYDFNNAFWGANEDSSGEILYGPGVINRSEGARFQISNLSATEDTAVRVTRRYSMACNFALLLYPESVLSTNVGVSVLVASPQVELSEVPTTYQAVGAIATGNPDADPNQHLPDDVWFIDQKIQENKYIIEWELASAFDLNGTQLPFRQVIQNACVWRYRGAECGYVGGPYSKDDIPCAPQDDFCAKRLSSCRARFGTGSLPYGGFPGAVRYDT